MAVDRIVRRDGTELTRVEQPLPMPQGVEDTAIGDWGGTSAPSLQFRGDSLPTTPTLFQNMPNPFNTGTVIRFWLWDVGSPQSVSLVIYNLAGQRIRTYHWHELGPGEHSIYWDGRDDLGREVGSGMYLYYLTTPEHTRARKMILLR